MAKSFSDIEIIRYKKRCADLYLKCYPQLEIAKKLGISQSTVSRLIAQMKEEWKLDAKNDFAEIVDRELAKIDKLEVEAWEAWEKSKRQRKSTDEKFNMLDDGEPTLVELRISKNRTPGDIRYYNAIESCMEKRAKYLGLYAPTKSASFNANSELTWEEFIKQGKKITDDDDE